MHKKELIRKVSEKTGIDPKICERITSEFIHELKEMVTTGHSITLKNFGRFDPVIKKPRKLKSNLNGVTGIIQLYTRFRVRFTTADNFLRLGKRRLIDTEDVKLNPKDYYPELEF